MSLENHKTKSRLHSCSKALLSKLINPALSRQVFDPATSNLGLVIPSPSIFDFSSPPADADADDAHPLPSAAECAAHLELLEVLYVLRQRILMDAGIDDGFAIKPEREVKHGSGSETKTLKDPTLWERRQVKWPKYIEFAAVRFLAWRRAVNQNPKTMIRRTFEGHLFPEHLPPLDILMVWHAFMLNPRMLATSCAGEPVAKLRMPWEAVHGAIKNSDWTFALDEDDRQHFEHYTGLDPDLFGMFSRWAADTEPDEPKLGSFKLLSSANSTNEKDLPKLNSSNGLCTVYTHLFTYIDGSLATQLRDAVIRQSEFVDKMNKHLWIRSPAIQGTLRRGIARYRHFLKLLKLYPGRTIVPTLDIDLVWHTHQCSSAAYAAATKAIVGRFINHDASLSSSQISKLPSRTSSIPTRRSRR
jgi:hypothetical protein